MTTPRLLLVWLLTGSLAWGHDAPLLLDDFEGDIAARWGGRVTAVTAPELVKEGQQALRWDTTGVAAIRSATAVTDWSESHAVALWVHSADATGAPIFLTFLVPDNPATEGGDYYFHRLLIDWTGWRRIELPLASLGRAREPVGFGQVEACSFHAVGWGQEAAVPGTVLVLDQLELLPLPPEERERRQAALAAVTAGQVTVLDDHHGLIDQFAAGLNHHPEQWRLSPAEAAAPVPVWHGVRLVASGQPVIWQRDYDLSLDGYDTLLVGAAVEPGASLRVDLAVAGGDPVSGDLAAGETTLALPLRAARLAGVTFTVTAAADHPAAGVVIESLVLRRPERISLRVVPFANRAALLTWSPPAWGAGRYQVSRDRMAITDLARSPRLASGRSAATSWLLDAPPLSGDWHYAVAPELAGGPGLAAHAAVTVRDEPTPTIVRATVPIAIDGDLADWASLRSGPPIALTAQTGYLHGEPLTGRTDLAGRVFLAADDDWLYLAAEVTDDVVAHRNAWAWEGDGLVVLLGPAVPSGLDRRYHLVICCPATTPVQAVILQDHTGVYSADAKPPAPGRYAVAIGPGGYVVELALPRDVLSRFGLRQSDARALAVGLSLHDSDQAEGETRRQRVLSWTQRENLYAGGEAALVWWP